jgi:uracil-DNA glycosylase family 4
MEELNSRITSCRLFPRLVEWREGVAFSKVRRYSDEVYWGKPVPGFGDPDARLLIVGLAPAAHGANRTGRMFTGDRSGEWLYRALHKAGFSNQPASATASDRLRLNNCYITAAVRCAPPGNKPTREEFANCRSYLLEEVSLLSNVSVVLGLGRIGFDAAVEAVCTVRGIHSSTRPRFAHGATFRIRDVRFLASYHPSQQNTFTGRLTESMFDAVFRKAVRLLS